MAKPADKAIAFLVKELSHSFASQSSPTQTPWRPQYHYQTTFVPSLILQAISSQPDLRLQSTKQRLYRHILKQQSAHWSFNYWARQTNTTKTFPYPDDLDDTFCALIALFSQRPNYIKQTALADVVKLLVATESQVGGPYRTWLTPQKEPVWQDVDLAVNANIAYFLSLIGSHLPNLDQYFRRHIKQADFASPYYPSAYPIWYYLARVCPPDSRTRLTQIIAKAQPDNSLELALTINALRQLDPQHQSLSKYRQQLIDQQEAGGGWPAAAFCLDPSRDNKQYFHGSRSLTTAFALEALWQTANSPKSATKATLHQDIAQMAKGEIAALPPHLRAQTSVLLERLITADPKHHISLLPYLFGQAYPTLPADFYRQLGLANLYGWMAYTVFDDFLDQEGQPAFLPAATFALRSSLQHFQAVLPNTAFQKLVTKTFNLIDNANSWEVTHCRWAVQANQLIPGRLPRYGQYQKLAERSLGHGLGPVAILVANGYPLSSPEVRNLQAAFRHYLIARQLDDDAHDWQADVSQGHLSPVVSQLLGDLDYQQPEPLSKLTNRMKQQFWHHSLPSLCDHIEQHVEAGKKLCADPLLQQLLSGIGASVQRTRQQQAQAASFLKNYRPKKIIKK